MASSSRYDSEIEAIVNNPNDLERDPTGQFIRLNKVVGIGTSKKVYEGLDTYNGIKIAWSKIEVGEIGKAGLRKCCQEAEMLKSLNHQNILKCYTYWYDGRKTINIITDLCSSGNLRDYILKHDLVRSTAAIKNWCRQILSALHYIHSQKIIHLDVNVANIVVNGNSGTVKLADFGVAVYKEADNVYSTNAGTPEYRAPEVSSYHYNHLADIHSFGMTVLQMVTYEKIYSEYENLADIETAVQSGFMPVALQQVGDPQLKRFIERCVAPASQRPAASELLKDPFLATTDEDDRSQDKPKPSRLGSDNGAVKVARYLLFWYFCWLLLISIMFKCMGSEWEMAHISPLSFNIKYRTGLSDGRANVRFEQGGVTRPHGLKGSLYRDQ